MRLEEDHSSEEESLKNLLESPILRQAVPIINLIPGTQLYQLQIAGVQADGLSLLEVEHHVKEAANNILDHQVTINNYLANELALLRKHIQNILADLESKAPN